MREYLKKRELEYESVECTVDEAEIAANNFMTAYQHETNLIYDDERRV